MREPLYIRPESSALANAFSEVSKAMLTNPPEERAYKQTMADYYAAKVAEANQAQAGKAAAQRTLASIVGEHLPNGNPVVPWTNPDTGEVIQNTAPSVPLESPEQRNARIRPLIAQGMMSGDKDVASMFKDALGAVDAYGTPDDMRRSMVLGGHNVTPNFAPTQAEGDRIRIAETDQEIRKNAAKPDNNVTPRNYVTPDGKQGFTLDGRTDGANGALIPQGSQIFTGQVNTDSAGKLPASVKSNAIEGNDSASAILSTVDELEKIVTPKDFGLTGTTRDVIQGVSGQYSAAQQWADQYADGILKQAIDLPGSITPEIAKKFDKNLGQKAILTHALTMQYARLLDPNAKTITDKDFDLAAKGLGISGPLSTYEDFKARMEIVKRLAETTQARTAARAPGMNLPGGAPAAPVAPTAPSGPVRVNSRAEAMALPPGTRFVTPDGKEKIRP